jgi:uncharacterized protein (TIGR02453 family)
MAFTGFDKSFFAFFRDLAAHNDRAWFEANKPRYKETVVAPCVAFIEAMAPRLKKISPHFVADPRPNGGSMFRIHRDTRFSKEKTPYKTHAGLQFRHADGKDAHAPGFYVHLEPGRVFFGGGVWMPDNPTLGRIRDAIVAKTPAWKRARGAASVTETFGDLADADMLARAPRGYDPAHPMIDDLRRKSFFVTTTATVSQASDPKFVDQVGGAFADSRPLMKFLTEAVGAAF